MKIDRKSLVVGALALAILLGLGMWFGMKLGDKDPASASKYAVVELSTGEVYFGKLHMFPHWKLTNVWALQRSQGSNGQPQVGVTPISKAFWGPVNELNLNRKEVVSWSYLRNDSELIKALENPDAVTGGAGTNEGIPSNSTSSFKGPNTQPPTTP
jgi:hypothetical protein